MSKITEAIRRKIEMAMKAFSLVISAICVGFFTDSKAKVKKAWSKTKRAAREFFSSLFKSFFKPVLAQPRLVPLCHSYEDGKELTLALIVESIKPRAPSF
jgi:hypothetical protein